MLCTTGYIWLYVPDICAFYYRDENFIWMTVMFSVHVLDKTGFHSLYGITPVHNVNCYTFVILEGVT